MYLLNPRLLGFECLRCRIRHPIGDYPTGCPHCLATGFPVSLKASYASDTPIRAKSAGHGLRRFASLLPYLDFPTLGEGDTLGSIARQIGQPDTDRMRLDNPLIIPGALSFLTYRRWSAQVKGLDAFPRELWPDNIPLLYYCYHIMVGLGTLFVAVMTLAMFQMVRRKLYDSRWLHWILMLAFPFPYIATTAGWITAAHETSW